MSEFIQIHVLTFYPPANLNRDDLGRPKTAMVGGKSRLRISSQCLKRTWRTSDVFKSALSNHLGIRTKKIGSEIVYPILTNAGIPEAKATEWAASIASTFGKLRKKDKKSRGDDIEQLVHLSPSELLAVENLAKTLAERKSKPTDQEMKLLLAEGRAVDIALFGRMLANSPKHNVEAAAQVAHAITVNEVALEDDFFTAVDDLNPREDSGAGHVDEHWYGSGTFYLYLSVNRSLLLENLDGDQTLADQALRALTEAVATVSPSGKQNSFAALSRASFVLAERGPQAPRSLALAFVKPIRNADPKEAIGKLKKTRNLMDSAYDMAPARDYPFEPGESGTFAGLLDFVTGD